MRRTTNNKRKGFVLVTALLVSSVLIAITVPYVSRVAAEYKLMAKIYNSTAALDLAEGAIERALWEIRYNTAAFTGWTTTTDANGNQISTVSVDSFQTASGTSIGDYTVTAVISADGMSATVTATGYVPNRTSPDGKRIIKVTCSKNNFGKAVLALNGITMTGSAYTDSYDSTLGAYTDQTPGQEGDVATNGAISMTGSTYIHGDANPGPSYPFSGTPSVSGSYGTLQAPFTVDPIPPTTLSAAQASNNNANIIHDPQKEPVSGTEFSLTGTDTVTFPAGTYYFTKFDTSGSALISISGAVTIYIDGGIMDVAGSGIINDGPPKNLLIYSTGTTINYSGSAQLSTAIYAPNASFKMTGSTDLFGAVICGSNTDTGSSAIHYDMDLKNVMPVFANSRVTSWQEIQQ